MTAQDDAPRPLAHEGLVYADEAHLLDVAVPFLREGIGAGDVVVAVTGHNELLREALGADAEQVEFADAGTWFARPATTYSSYRQFVDERLTEGVAATVLAEAVWATRSAAEVTEWQRLEAAVNAAFASAPMRVLCCYDGRDAPRGLQESALQTHPLVYDAGGVAESSEYLDPETFIDGLERSLQLPAAPQHATRVPIGPDLAALRALLRTSVTEAKLSEDRSADVVLAVHELLTNHLKYSGGPGELLLWGRDGELVCEIRDLSGRRPPPLAGYQPPPPGRIGGWGLPLVRQIAELVHVADRGDHAAIRTVFRG